VKNRARRLKVAEAGLFHQVGVPEFGALGAHAVGKFDLEAVADIGFDLLPVPGGLVDFLAGSADGQMFGGSDSVCRDGGVLQLRWGLRAFEFSRIAGGDVAAVDDHAADVGVVEQIVGNDFQ